MQQIQITKRRPAYFSTRATQTAYHQRKTQKRSQQPTTVTNTSNTNPQTKWATPSRPPQPETPANTITTHSTAKQSSTPNKDKKKFHEKPVPFPT